MPGIRLEQLDLASISRYFANVKTLKDKLKEFDDKYSETLSNIEDKIKKDGILQTLGSLTEEELKALNIYASIIQSTKVSEISNYSVTESDEVTYEIEPSKGYINVDGNEILVYQHPKYHNANEIIETTDKRFSSSRQQEDWSSRVTYNALSTIINALTEKIEKLERDIFEMREDDENTQIEELQLLFNTMYNNSIITRDVTGNNTKKITISHNLSTQDLIVSVYRELQEGSLELVYPNIYFNNLNSLDLTFNDTVPLYEKYKVVIINKFNLNTIYTDINNLCKSFITTYKFTYSRSIVNRTVTIPNPIIPYHDDNENIDLTRNALFVTVVDTTTNEIVYPKVEITDSNIEITFDFKAEIGNEYNIIVLNPQSIIKYLYLDEPSGNENTVQTTLKNYIIDKFKASYDLIEITKSGNDVVVNNINNFGLFNENSVITKEGNKYISLVDPDDELDSGSVQAVIYGYKDNKSELIYSKNNFFIDSGVDNDNIFECLFKLQSSSSDIMEENDFERIYILLFYNI